MSSRSSFKKGTIELLLLSILSQDDCYGYQITQSIKKLSEGLITVTEGALYPILYRLLDKGYVTNYKKLVGKRMTRVYYHLEPQGYKYFLSLREDYDNVHMGVRKVLEAAHNATPPGFMEEPE